MIPLNTTRPAGMINRHDDGCCCIPFIGSITKKTYTAEDAKFTNLHAIRVAENQGEFDNKSYSVTRLNLFCLLSWPLREAGNCALETKFKKQESRPDAQQDPFSILESLHDRPSFFDSLEHITPEPAETRLEKKLESMRLQLEKFE